MPGHQSAKNLPLTRQLFDLGRVAAADRKIASRAAIRPPVLRKGEAVDMERAIGFLESELDRAVATFGQAASAENVVPMDPLRSQATLRERERRFRQLLDALPAAVYTTDASGRITYYNEAA